MTPLPKSNNKELLLWLLRQRKRFRVVGYSMTPTLLPEEEVLVNYQAYQHFGFAQGKQDLPQVGEIVIAHHPQRDNFLIIKRITQIQNHQYFLKGDNLAESTDSRHFGWLKAREILGRVVCRFP